MYKKILIALENGPADETILPHVIGTWQTAAKCANRVLLLHVADGWAARNFNELELAESEEMKKDRAYLEKVAAELRRRRAFPSKPNWRSAIRRRRSSKGRRRRALRFDCHEPARPRLFGDCFYGSTITERPAQHFASRFLLVRSARSRSRS